MNTRRAIMGRLVLPGVGLLIIAGCLVFAVAIAWRGRSRAKARREEGGVVAALKVYHRAQVMFHRYDWDVTLGCGPPNSPGATGVLEYASDFRDLNETVDGGAGSINLIPFALTNAKAGRGEPYCGYYFLDLHSIGERPIDWRKDFGLCATPAEYGKTGISTFVVTSDGHVWSKDLGRSRHVPDFPADPSVAGWRMADSLQTE